MNEELEEEEEEHFLTDEKDHQILMHRDAHFGGDFGVMLHYYQKEGLGTHPDIDIERISFLAQIEKEMSLEGEGDLAPLMLSVAEAEAVGRAKKAYIQLKEIYSYEEKQGSHARLIADLILSEEEEPLAEIEAVVACGKAIVPELLLILRSDEAYDPLFPGYGYAPYLAAQCLGAIGDPEAIIALFEALSKPLIFEEDAILDALAAIGEPACQFLLKVLKSRPLTHDNRHAAFALSAFSHHLTVAEVSFAQLQDPQVQKNPLLSTYLLCNCEALKDTPGVQALLMQMSQDSALPASLRRDIQSLLKEWIDAQKRKSHKLESHRL